MIDHSTNIINLGGRRPPCLHTRDDDKGVAGLKMAVTREFGMVCNVGVGLVGFKRPLQPSLVNEYQRQVYQDKLTGKHIDLNLDVAGVLKSTPVQKKNAVSVSRGRPIEEAPQSLDERLLNSTRASGFRSGSSSTPQPKHSPVQALPIRKESKHPIY